MKIFSRSRGALLVAVLVVSDLVGAVGVPLRAVSSAPALDRSSRPDPVSASQAARRSGVPIQVTGATTETRTRWANPDGTFTDDLSASPVRTRRGETWLPIDTTLRVTEGAVRPVATVGDVVFSNGGYADLATVTEHDVTVGLGWRGALQPPTLNGSAARYQNVAPGLDLELQARPAGFEQSFIVKEPRAAARSYRLPLLLRGVTTSTTDRGTVFRDADGVERAWVGAAMMWDRNAARMAPVRVGVVATSAGPHLEMTPDPAFMADPAIEYPITIDPTITIRRWSDTFADSATPTTSYGGSAYLKIGRQGTNVLRSFISWDLAEYAGTHITDVYEHLGNWYSASCLPKTTLLYRITQPWTPSGLTWNAQPNIDTAAGPLASATTAAGGGTGSGCEGTNWMTFHSDALTAQFNAWANGAANYGHTIRTSETDLLAAKTFLSGEATSWQPRVRITFNNHPATVAGRYVTPAYTDSAGVRWTTSRTPTFAGGSCDPDASDVRIDHELWNSTQSTLISSSSLPPVPSCSYALWTPSDALADGTYKWRARAFDGTDYSKSWSSWVTTIVDTVAPATAPSVTSTSFPQTAWSGSDGQAGTVTFGPNGANDVAGYYYGLDDPTTPTYTTNPTVTLTPSEGAHTLYVSSADRAGNRSAATQYSFGVGHVGITSPLSGARTQKTFTLSVSVRPGATYIQWYWRRGGDYWQVMSNLRDVNGKPISELYVEQGVAPVVTWDVPASVGTDGAIEIAVQVSGRDFIAVLSQPRTVALDRTDYAAASATTRLGPGVVNLLNGNLQVTQNDVSLAAPTAELAVSRTYNTRSSGTSYSPFGPGWRMNVGVPTAESEFESLTVEPGVGGSVATLTFPGSAALTFVGGAGTWTPEAGSEDLTLTGPTNDTYAVTDLDGNVTTFALHAGSTKYVPSTVQQAGQPDVATYAYESVSVDGVAVSRVTGVMAPEPTGIDGCTIANPYGVVGCRSLLFDYAAHGTPVPPAGAVGDFAHRLRSVTAVLYDPATSSMRGVEVARFAYDPVGRLAEAWDPRLPSIRSTYSYDSFGRLVTANPGGSVPWTIAYADLAGESNSGRVRSVSRPSLVSSRPTAKWTVVFDVPMSGPSAPYDLSPTQLDRTGQRDRPVTATAIFPPDTATVLAPDASSLPVSYDRAHVHYLNRDGRQVNTADAAGGVATTEYDSVGRVTRMLSPPNRARALERGLTSAEEAEISRDLSTLTTYSADGLRILETFGPERLVRLAGSGEITRGRPHSVYTYDEGAPAGGPYHLVTTTVAGVRVKGEPTDRASEARATKSEYGTTPATWRLGRVTATINDAGAGGLANASRSTYTADGRVLSETLPAGGTRTDTAATRLTRYYTAGPNAEDAACGNRPEWADLACAVAPGGQPNAGPGLPTTYFTYDAFANVLTSVERLGTQTLRTTTTTYDDVERVVRVGTTAAAGTPLPDVEFVYDANGNVAETRSTKSGVTRSVKRTINALGQTTLYRDADGSETTSAYDVAGRLVETFDGKGGQTITYGDARGLPTALTDTHAGTWTASYDLAGAPTVQWPNGIRETWRTDEADALTSLTYARTSDCVDATCTLLEFGGYRSVHGELLEQWSTLSAQSFGYDRLSRLTSVDDSVGGVCTTRRYTYDGGASGNSNRTRLESFASGTATCSTSVTATTIDRTYDTADRLTTSGTTYDALGRTTAVPLSDVVSGGGLSVSYYVNDLVASISQSGGSTTTYELDVDQDRVHSWVNGGVTRTNHFSDDSDNPSWVQESPTTWTRNVRGIRGDLAAIRDSAGGTTYQLTNMHGDVVATMSDGTTLSETFESTEFGAPRGTVGRRYGWLGGKRRASDLPGGLSLMGVRLYNPATGRFLQPDPVYGGSANTYEYAGQNPITNFDLDGRVCVSATRCGPGMTVWIVGVAIRGGGASVRVVSGAIAVTLSTGVVIYASAHAIDPYDLVQSLRLRMAHRKKPKIESNRKPHETMKNGKKGADKHSRADGHGGHHRAKNPNKNPDKPKAKPKPKPRKDNGLDELG